MKLKTHNRIIDQKVREQERLAIENERVVKESERLRGALHERQMRIDQLEAALNVQRQRAERAEQERQHIQASLDKFAEEKRFLLKELSGYVLRTPTEPFWKNFPVEALRILKQNFLDGKRAEGAIDGHQQIPCKCGRCGLHLIVLTWFPDRHDGRSFYCPECGEQSAGEMGRRNVPWEIGQACVQAGAKPIGFKQMGRNRRRGISGGTPVRSLIEIERAQTEESK